MIKLNSKYVKNFILFICLFYLTLIIPLLFTIYSYTWYNFNYNQQENSLELNKTLRDNVTENLISFFKYESELNNNWNLKEKTHMYEVRNIYLSLIIIGFLFGIILFFLFDKNLILKFSLTNIFIIISFFIFIPSFNYLFSGIFHQILFNNNYWIINENDISYYLFEETFFKNSFVFIILFALFENVFIHIYLKFKLASMKTHIYK